jgi:16S rRNA (guanine(966)-N(2))-methyltransferase RsmD
MVLSVTLLNAGGSEKGLAHMGTLRVIGGSAKGLRLKTVPGDTTRPITDLVKEALFNILGDEVLGNKVLDVFGGTGAVGIEALSRGAESALFLDKSREAVRIIQENLRATHLNDKAEVQHQDAFIFLAQAASSAYDLIYIAPPQYKGMWQKALDLLDAQPQRLSPDGQIIVQSIRLSGKNARISTSLNLTLESTGIRCLCFLNTLKLKTTSPTDRSRHSDIRPKKAACLLGFARLYPAVSAGLPPAGTG